MDIAGQSLSAVRCVDERPNCVSSVKHASKNCITGTYGSRNSLREKDRDDAAASEMGMRQFKY
jgi:hypothetical protein